MILEPGLEKADPFEDQRCLNCNTIVPKFWYKELFCSAFCYKDHYNQRNGSF